MNTDERLVEQGRFITFDQYGDNGEYIESGIIPLARHDHLRCGPKVVKAEFSEFTLAGSAQVGPLERGLVALPGAEIDDIHEPRAYLHYDNATFLPHVIELHNLVGADDTGLTQISPDKQTLEIATFFTTLTGINFSHLRFGQEIIAPDELTLTIHHDAAKGLAPFIRKVENAANADIDAYTDLETRAARESQRIFEASSKRMERLRNFKAPQAIIDGDQKSLERGLDNLADPGSSSLAHSIVSDAHARLARAYEHLDHDDYTFKAVEHWQKAGDMHEKLAILEPPRGYIDDAERAERAKIELQLAGLSYAYAAQNAMSLPQAENPRQAAAELNESAFQYLNPNQWGFYQVLEGRPLIPRPILGAALAEHDASSE